MRLWDNKKGSRSGVIRSCRICGTQTYSIPSRARNGRGKYCSYSCRAKYLYPKQLKSFSGGKIAKRAGGRALTKFNQLVRSGKVQSPVWKGSEVKYGSLHSWIVRFRGKPTKCESCGTTDPSERYEWANIDHKYRRDLSDYRRMCLTCHRIFDFAAAKERRKLYGSSKLSFVPKR